MPPSGEVIVDSCFRVLPGMKADSVDLVMTSPPYDNQSRYNTSEEYPKSWFDGPFLSCCADILRILKPTGSFVLNYRSKRGEVGRGTIQFELVSWMIDLGFIFADDYVWGKPTPPPGIYKRVLKDGFEYCFHFAKSPSWKFFPESCLVPSRVSEEERTYRTTLQPQGDRRTRGPADRSRRRTTSYPAEVLPSTLLLINPDFGRNPSKHPARFPVALPEFFIKLLTEPGDLVVDPFAGTGTTAVAAEKLNRRWLMIEEQARYIEGLPERLR